MKNLFVTIFLVCTATNYSQNEISWSKEYQLQQSDFQSPSTQIGNTNIINLMTSSGFDFAISMSNFEFMFTKNFNSKVTNAFKRESAAIVAPDKETAVFLIGFAQYQFDLAELYARKLRKKLNEDKKAFSNISFFKPIYDEIQNEYSQKITSASKETEMGKNVDKLEKLQKQVIADIEELATYCKECKILKKKNIQ